MKNEYGLDDHYFGKKLKAIVRDIKHYTPSEMINELRTLLAVAERQEVEKQEMLKAISIKRK